MVPWSEVASGIGMAGGLWAVVRWLEERKNGHEPPRPLAEAPDVTLERDLAFKKVADHMEEQTRLFVEHHEEDRALYREHQRFLSSYLTEVTKPQADPEWIKGLTERMEAVLQMGPPVINVEPAQPTPPAPVDFTEVNENLESIKKNNEELRRMVARTGGPKWPHPARLNPQPRPASDPVLTVPGMPPPYVAGTVVIPHAKPSNLLLMIQQQLQPNCPGTCVQFRISADASLFVGTASILGGPLSEENFGYVLLPGEKVMYASITPGYTPPLGDIQVLTTSGTADLHVEVLF
jgi:hypothetical protein